MIVLKDNRPVLASSAIGSGLQEVTLQNLINVLDLGMDPQAAVNRPNFLGPFLGITTNGSPKPELTEEVLDRGFSPSVVKGLKKRGQDLRRTRRSDTIGLLDWHSDRPGEQSIMGWSG